MQSLCAAASQKTPSEASRQVLRGKVPNPTASGEGYRSSEQRPAHRRSRGRATSLAGGDVGSPSEPMKTRNPETEANSPSEPMDAGNPRTEREPPEAGGWGRGAQGGRVSARSVTEEGKGSGMAHSGDGEEDDEDADMPLVSYSSPTYRSAPRTLHAIVESRVRGFSAAY